VHAVTAQTYRAMINASQIKAARALLGLGQQELASRAKCGIATIRRIEASTAEVTGNAQTIVRIQRALEAAGVRFVDQDEHNGPGVRLRRRQP
jgi:transcriptional regulator with XRE-family HTH domain